MAELRVRLIRPEDYARVAELTLAAYAREYTLSDHYRADLADVAGRVEQHEVWVAQDETGHLVGAVVTPRPGGRVSELAGDGEFGFRMLAVDPTVGRSGIGRFLVGHVVQLARERGADRVVMNSGPQMVGAHRLYERLGFSRLVERETRVLPDGTRLLAFGLDLLPERATTRSSG